MQLSPDTFQRPADLRDESDPRALYARSYLITRLAVGALGVALPTLMFLIEAPLLRGAWEVRGSLSAYYHSGARDLFVGALCITGFLLITYMSAQKKTWDFVLSSLAGVGAIGVALLPTMRPGLTEQALRCGARTDVVPAGCTQLQQALGERAVAAVHFGCAVVFIVTLAFICLLFSRREHKYTRREGRARFHLLCMVTIFVAIAWFGIGHWLDIELFGLKPLYVTEVASVYAFGASWLVKGWDLLSS